MLLEDIAEQATRAWSPPNGERAVVALDFMRVFVPEPRQMFSQPGDMELPPLAFPAAASFALPPSLPWNLSFGHNPFPPTIGINNYGMLPTAWETDYGNTIDRSFYSGAPSGDISDPSIPIPIGQSGLSTDLDSI